MKNNLTKDQEKVWDVLKTPTTERDIGIIIENTLANFIGYRNEGITRSNIKNDLTYQLGKLVINKRISKYNVICDETNNPPTVVKNNEVHCSVNIKYPQTISYINYQVVLK